jgi:hypothetical protein
MRLLFRFRRDPQKSVSNATCPAYSNKNDSPAKAVVTSSIDTCLSVIKAANHRFLQGVITVARLAVVVLLGFHTAHAAKAAIWEELYRHDGLTIFQQPLGTQKLPRYRAKGVLDDNMFSMLAVLNDFKRHREWMRYMSESEIIERFDDFNLLMYARFDAPWPVWDRDTILDVSIDYNRSEKKVEIVFKSVNHPSRPPLEGVIRVPRFDVTMNLHSLEAQQTEMDYIQNIRPGGDLPHWVVRWLSRKVPVDTIEHLQEQIEKTRGSYQGFFQRFALDKARKL